MTSCPCPPEPVFPDAALAIAPVADTDFDRMADLRDLAMRPSLEQLGRYDPERSRLRLRAGFVPACMRWIRHAGQDVGFYSLRAEDGAWRLDHLYLHPDAQGRGLGSAVLQALIAGLRPGGLPLRVTALRGSASNGFYVRHGFAQTGEAEWDIDYERPALPA